MIKIVRFGCGKYGVTDDSGFYDSGMSHWTMPYYIARYCKMYRWLAKRLLKKLDISYDDVGDGNK